MKVATIFFFEYYYIHLLSTYGTVALLLRGRYQRGNSWHMWTRKPLIYSHNVMRTSLQRQWYFFFSRQLMLSVVQKWILVACLQLSTSHALPIVYMANGKMSSITGSKNVNIYSASTISRHIINVLHALFLILAPSFKSR